MDGHLDLHSGRNAITLSSFVPSGPPVAVVLEVALYRAIRMGREVRKRDASSPFHHHPHPLLGAVVMLVVLVSHNMLHPDRIVSLGINRDIPFIPVLIVAPIAAGVCLWMLKRGSSFPFCVDCKLRFDTPAERGFLGMLFSQEGHLADPGSPRRSAPPVHLLVGLLHCQVCQLQPQ